jgi:hypothetical protein
MACVFSVVRKQVDGHGDSDHHGGNQSDPGDKDERGSSSAQPPAVWPRIGRRDLERRQQRIYELADHRSKSRTPAVALKRAGRNDRETFRERWPGANVLVCRGS